MAMEKTEATTVSIGLLAGAFFLCFFFFRLTGCEMSRNAAEAGAEVEIEKIKLEREKIKLEKLQTYTKLGDKVVVIEAEAE